MSETPTVEQNREHWDNDAAHWAAEKHPVITESQSGGGKYSEARRLAIADALKRYSPLKGKRGLDVGSGHGVRNTYFKGQVETEHVLLADISPKMLELSGEKHTMIMDASKPLELESSSFDWVVAFFLMRYLTQKEQKDFMAEVHRVLLPGGFSLFLDHQTLEHPLERGFFQPEILVEEYKGTALLQVKLLLRGVFAVNQATHRGVYNAKKIGNLQLLEMRKP